MTSLQSSARVSDRVDDYVRYRPDYPPAALQWIQREQGVTTRRKAADVGAGFRSSTCFDHAQQLDFDALKGRLMSSSYAPQQGRRQHAPMLLALRDLLDACAARGTISFDYDTRVLVGQPA